MTSSDHMIVRAPEVAAHLKLLSNPNRLMIVCRLLKSEMSVGDIEEELGIKQPTLSRELGHLREAEIITPRRQSKVVFYALTDMKMRDLIQAICRANEDDISSKQVSTGSNSHPESTKTISFNPRPKFTKTSRFSD